MQANIYLFGDLGSGYTQYLDDFTREIFKDFAKQIRSKTQLLIHREDRTVYYTYIRRLSSGLSSNRYIGMCYAVSGNLIIDYNGLFRIFESAITTLTVRGVILQFTDAGDITSSAGQLYKCKSEFSQISDYLNSQLGTLDASKVKSLPPLDYSINTHETKHFSIKSPALEIEKSIGTFSYVYISKDENFDSDNLHSYSCLLNDKKKIIDTLQQENGNLKNECQKLKLAQKRFKAVAILSFVVFFISLLSISLYKDKKQLGEDLTSTQGQLESTSDSLSNTKQDLSNTKNLLSITEAKLKTANATIDNLNTTIDAKDRRISDLNDNLTKSNKDLQRCRTENSSLKNEVKRKDNRIRELSQQLKDKSNVVLSGSDFQLKLYNSNENRWVYSVTSSYWGIPRKKGGRYSVYIYYKGNYVTQQALRID